MSILRWLDQAGAAHRNLFVNNTHFVYSEDALAETLLQSPSIKFLSSHFILTFPPRLAGRPMLYFTLLRDPVQQFISYLTYVKKEFAVVTDPNLLSCLPPDPCSLSSREFTRWLLSQDRDDIPFRENYTVNRLAMQTYLSRQDPAAPFDRAAFRAVRLTVAKEVLNQCIAVGLTEQMHESVAQLRKIASSHDVHLPPGPVGMVNSSSEFRDDLSWIHPADEVGAMLLHSLQEDRQLYDWAAARFARERRANSMTNVHLTL
jgi:hypothetical protein